MTDSKKPRTTKTPKQRAEEALAVADRRVAKLTAERDAADTARATANVALAEAVRRRDYLRQDPALPQSATEKAVAAAQGGIAKKDPEATV
jgi:hypothetical protein